MEIKIDMSKFSSLMDKEVEKSLKGALKNHLDYWVRQEINKRIADEFIKKVCSDLFPKERIEKILKDAFEKYVWDKMEVEKYYED